MQDNRHAEMDASVNVSPLLASFDYAPRTRVVFGPGTFLKLGELAKELGTRRAFLVTDAGLREAGHEQRGIASLEAAGLHVTVFDKTSQNPTTDDVNNALAVAREADIDLIVGLGGGSSMDCAKGVNFVLTNGGEMEDYWGIGKATKPMLPMIAVPTTSGTGSEAQSFALIANAKTHAKMACGDKKAACKIAILDPELTVSMPKSVTVATGIDAISHAVETFVTKSRNPVSNLFSRKAWQLLHRGFPAVLRDPGNLEARAAMLLGAHFAGAAIENSMLGATHALANSLTAHFNVIHGTAIGVMLPHVIRYNSEDDSINARYHQLATDAGLSNGSSDTDSGTVLADAIGGMIAESGSAINLQTLNVNPETIPTMAAEAAKQWTGNFNPRPVDATSLEELYRCALTDESS